METITVEGKTFVVITREDGSSQTIEASESNPEYAYIIKKITDSE